jgi:hypothetical protein
MDNESATTYLKLAVVIMIIIGLMIAVWVY